MKSLMSFVLVIFMIVSCDRSDETSPDASPDVEAANATEDLPVIISIEEWDVPFDETRSRDPYVSPDGRIFFAGQRDDYIGFFNPETAEFDYNDLDDGTGPHTVVVANDGTLWYAGNRARHIGKMDPDTGEITKFHMDNDYARDPHTFAFNKDGNIWFTAQGGNGVGLFDVTSGEATIIPVPTPNARPYGIVMDPAKEQPWIALFGTNKLATVNPETMQLEEIELPREETRVRRLDVISDGTVWYGDFSTGYMGRYDPSDGSIEEWEMPDGEVSRPYAVLADDKDRIWLSASGLDPNKLVGFDTNSREFVASEVVETAMGSIRHIVFDKPTRSIWFGTDTGHIGRAVIN
jgi:virginiamycin B lyase